jgi:hypothetical protein
MFTHFCRAWRLKVADFGISMPLQIASWEKEKRGTAGRPPFFGKKTEPKMAKPYSVLTFCVCG